MTIGTDFNGRGGILGKIERWMSNRILHPIYVEELGRLDRMPRIWLGCKK